MLQEGACLTSITRCYGTPDSGTAISRTQFSSVARRLGREVLEPALGTIETDTLAWWTSFPLPEPRAWRIDYACG